MAGSTTDKNSAVNAASYFRLCSRALVPPLIRFGYFALGLAGWIFSILGFYLFMNTVAETASLNRFYAWGGAVVIPLALISVWQQTTGTPMSYGLVELPLQWVRPGLTLPIRYGHWEIHATLINSIVLAGFVLCWLPFYVSRWKDHRWYALPIGAGLICLLLARSWLAYLMALLVYVVWHRGVLMAHIQRRPAVFLFTLAFGI